MDTPSKAAPISGHKHLPSTREQRGIELYRSGAVHERGDLYVVRGASRSSTVSLVDGEPRCDCPDFGKKRETCKHGYSVVIHAAKKRCRSARTAADRPSRRHGERQDGTRSNTPGDGRASGPGRTGGIAPRRSCALDPAFVRANVARMGG